MIENKICPYCKSDIARDAIKCPACREWLNKTSLSFKNPYLLAVLIPVLYLGLFFGVRKFYFDKISQSSLFQPPIEYSKDSKLTILESKLFKNEKGTYLIGSVRNDEKFKWDTVEILVSFKDENNEVVYLSDKVLFDLRPGEKRPFQIDSGCSSVDLNTVKFSEFEIEIERGNARI